MNAIEAPRSHSTRFTPQAADRIRDLANTVATTLSRGVAGTRETIAFRFSTSLSRLAVEHAVANQAPELTSIEVDAVMEAAVEDFFQQIDKDR
ncbi:MAG: hypothetical protein KBA40_03890 [Candidatus Peribacteraceae bacterium]|nr:hypothetical protein [Candidatus Peribacteraceae bacterium]MBP9850651.1 hypothetical protein [Candidatus Peribacteraceae bacterium]